MLREGGIWIFFAVFESFCYLLEERETEKCYFLFYANNKIEFSVDWLRVPSNWYQSVILEEVNEDGANSVGRKDGVV